MQRERVGDGSMLRDRLHPCTRVAAECKRGSTVLNIHLTFPSGYTRRWRTSIPKIKERLARSWGKRRRSFAKKNYRAFHRNVFSWARKVPTLKRGIIARKERASALSSYCWYKIQTTDCFIDIQHARAYNYKMCNKFI